MSNPFTNQYHNVSVKGLMMLCSWKGNREPEGDQSKLLASLQDAGDQL